MDDKFTSMEKIIEEQEKVQELKKMLDLQERAYNMHNKDNTIGRAMAGVDSGPANEYNQACKKSFIKDVQSKIDDLQKRAERLENAIETVNNLDFEIGDAVYVRDKKGKHIVRHFNFPHFHDIESIHVEIVGLEGFSHVNSSDIIPINESTKAIYE